MRYLSFLQPFRYHIMYNRCHPSPVSRQGASQHVREPFVLQCFFGCESSRGIDIRHSHNKVLEIRVKVLPQFEWAPWIVRIKVCSYHGNELSPRTIAKVSNQSFYTLPIREVRELAFENNVQDFDAFWNLLFVDREYHSLCDGIDTLQNSVSEAVTLGAE
jgi:hypothetical protein